ncbi:MAG TPA: efflux RND transporter periplasmic adaptor subunit [Bryobacteraceae bacterium]|nr:efflux RND transporter periplasmic adaptor subunit [Bryobacteraceae bacterium]
MKKKLIPVIVLIVVAAVVVIGGRSWFHSGDGRSIRVSGNIELTEVNISFKIPGKLIERHVDEGDRVTAGMLLARLDKDQLVGQNDRARGAVASAESQQAQQTTSIDFQAATLEGQIQQRSAEVQAAEARLAALVAGSRVQEKQEAQAAVDRAQTEYDRAAADWKRGQTLIKNEDISAADFDQYRTRYETADAQLKTAKEQLALVLEGPRKEDIDAARAQLATAQAVLRLAEAQRIELKRQRQQLVQRTADLVQRKADLSVVQTQLDDTEAFSPIGGVVLVKSAEVGEVVAAGTAVLTVGDIDHPWVRAYISESDKGRVKLGDKVNVTTDSYPGKIYPGRVSFISAEAEFTPKQIQTAEERAKLVYRVKIAVDNPKGELNSNMPADAEILLGGE